MDSSTSPAQDSPQPPSRWDATAVTLVINGVLVGSAGVYTATGSTTITIVACVSAIVLVTGILLLQSRSSGGAASSTDPVAGPSHSVTGDAPEAEGSGSPARPVPARRQWWPGATPARFGNWRRTRR